MRDQAQKSKRKPVNVMLEEELFWKGREHAARLRLPNISGLIEQLLVNELRNPTIKPRAKAA